METSHEIILAIGVLFLAALFAGQASMRVGFPVVLVFIAIGMLAGEDGPGGIQFSDLHSAYLIGSLALAVILFEGGLHTRREMLRKALWPAMLLATLGVAVSVLVVGAAAALLFHVPWAQALLLGAVMVPTDAAAVSVLLRLSRAPVPSRVAAVLEIESGLNDPMSVFLTVTLVEYLAAPAASDWAHTFLVLLEEMGGGAVFGCACGYALLWLFRRMRAEQPLFPVLAFGSALAIFGGAQVIGASGFLAVYLTAVIAGNYRHPAAQSVTRFFETFGWLAQITLFLMLGLLVTPHDLPPLLLPAVVVSVLLVLVARPAGVLASLLPFRWSLPEAGFVAWAGLRGAVPIYLTIIPLFAGLPAGEKLFNIVFVVVIVSVVVQGWTLNPIARLLGLNADHDAESEDGAPSPA